ncbi:redoxin domain-containing protein [Mycolicibacterium fortuitum]|uniref:redoxin domain-containing protein n=1 Tax=Mycolicibacterium fortuitum TaxID=1766 RepID=UPI00148FA68D|nr:redoxin domain-containing protein [Mycolicibacterium fortuitum]
MGVYGWIARAATVAVVLAGCAGGGGQQTQLPATSTSGVRPDAAEPVMPEQLQFTSTLVDGVRFEGASLAGKDAVLWFWAPWCGECRREAPHVAAVQKATGNTVVIMGVAGRGDTADMRSFIDATGVGGFAHIADTDGSVWQRFGVVQQPAYAFIDDTGTVTVVRGSLGKDELAARVDALSNS